MYKVVLLPSGNGEKQKPVDVVSLTDALSSLNFDCFALGNNDCAQPPHPKKKSHAA